MLSRRGFLGYAGAGAVAVGCYPGAGGLPGLFAAPPAPTDLEAMRKLPERARWVPAYVAAERRLRGETRTGAFDWVARKALDRATKGEKRKQASARQPTPAG